MKYADYTINDKNIIKRTIQRGRLVDAVRILAATARDFKGSVLDFGGGNGELSRMIAIAYPDAQVFCYEPAAHLFAEAKEHLREIPNITLIQDVATMTSMRVDCVFCLEVFEHLPKAQTDEALAAIERLTKENGRIVIGVPNEIFIPALYKGAFRFINRPKEYEGRLSNIFRAVLGIPFVSRPMEDLSAGIPYHFYHTGFDFRKFRTVIAQKFALVDSYGSPLRFLGKWLNSEIYFVLKKRKQVSHAN